MHRAPDAREAASRHARWQCGLLVGVGLSFLDRETLMTSTGITASDTFAGPTAVVGHCNANVGDA